MDNKTYIGATCGSVKVSDANPIKDIVIYRVAIGLNWIKTVSQSFEEIPLFDDDQQAKVYTYTYC